MTIALQRPDLLGVGLRVGVEVDQGGPVPAGTDRQHRVERGGGLVVAPEGEEAQAAEFVQGRVVGQLAQRLVGQVEGPRVIAPV